MPVTKSMEVLSSNRPIVIFVLTMKIALTSVTMMMMTADFVALTMKVDQISMVMTRKILRRLLLSTSNCFISHVGKYYGRSNTINERRIEGTTSS